MIVTSRIVRPAIDPDRDGAPTPPASGDHPHRVRAEAGERAGDRPPAEVVVGEPPLPDVGDRWPDGVVRGEPLVHRLPGRFGWELRLVVQGGLRILDKIEAHGFNALGHRPTIGALDVPLLLWRSLWMPRGSTALLSDQATR